MYKPTEQASPQGDGEAAFDHCREKNQGQYHFVIKVTDLKIITCDGQNRHKDELTKSKAKKNVLRRLSNRLIQHEENFSNCRITFSLGSRICFPFFP